jgi:hypothetical protein
MKMNINMFGTCVESGVFGKSDCALIIAGKIDRKFERSGRNKTNFREKFTDPNNIL